MTTSVIKNYVWIVKRKWTPTSMMELKKRNGKKCNADIVSKDKRA